jgi:alpha-galactosidase
MNATGRQMVFSCSWAVYFTECTSDYPPAQWEEQCGRVPWDDSIISDACHLWRYGEDLRPSWGEGADAPASKRLLSGTGGGGVGDVIEFASSIYAYNWRGVTGPGAFNDPDFLIVGCPTDRPCESAAAARGAAATALVSSAGAVDPPSPPLSDIEQRTQFSMWCVLAAPLILGADVRTLSPTALATLTNKAAIAINQDEAALPPRLIHKGGCSEMISPR